MSEHAHTTHPVPAVIMILVIAALLTGGVLLMNAGHEFGAYIAGALLALFGCFSVLVLGRE